MINRIKKSLNNQNGLNTIELAIITIIVIICVCGLIDLTNIMQKHTAVSSTINYVTRTVGKQGGVQKTKPAQFAGEYTTSSQLYTDVKENLSNAGIASTNWHLYVTLPGKSEQELKANSVLPIIDYGQQIKVRLTISYIWNMSAQVIPFSMNGDNESIRQVTSTFKIRNNSSLTTDVK